MVTLTPTASAQAELRELVDLSRLFGFDLAGELRSITDAGGALFDCEVDEEATKAAGHVVDRYKLPQRLHVHLTALRTRQAEIDEVKGCSRVHAAS